MSTIIIPTKRLDQIMARIKRATLKRYAKWGYRSQTSVAWYYILLEEMQEVYEAHTANDKAHLIRELEDVTVAALAWLEDLTKE